MTSLADFGMDNVSGVTPGGKRSARLETGLAAMKGMRHRWLDWLACPYRNAEHENAPQFDSPSDSDPERGFTGSWPDSSDPSPKELEDWTSVGLHRVAGVLLMSGPYDLEAAAAQFIRRGMSVSMLLGIMGG